MARSRRFEGAPPLPSVIRSHLLTALAGVVAIGLGSGCAAVPGAAYDGPIIDMHLHAFEWDRYGAEPPPNPASGRVPEARTDEEAAQASLAELERHGVVKAVASGPASLVRQWSERGGERIVPALMANSSDELPPLEALEALADAGRLAVLGELAPQYAGGTLADDAWQPYLAFAERRGIPVAVHTGVGPPRTPYGCCPWFRTTLGRPSHLEDVLVRYPKLRVYLMHAGAPWGEETLALLHVYPHVYVDVAVVDWVFPRKQFHDYLEELVEAGFEDRILFGSDQMIWPDAIGLAVEGVDSAPFLTAEQKRKIFHDNAARFLGLPRP